MTAPPELTLRPIAAGDRDFLLALYASTRASELALVPWSDEEKAAFVAHQFQAQHDWWTSSYSGTSFDLVLCDGEPVGRLYVGRWESEIRVVDVAVAPGWRGRGLGERLLRGVMAEGRSAGKPVTIHVEQFNPARRLYERLGFQYAGTVSGVYLKMAWEPTDSEGE